MRLHHRDDRIIINEQRNGPSLRYARRRWPPQSASASGLRGGALADSLGAAVVRRSLHLSRANSRRPTGRADARLHTWGLQEMLEASIVGGSSAFAASCGSLAVLT
jgi:hypothetical protein